MKILKLYRVCRKMATNGKVLPKVGRKSATASPKHKSFIVALMLNLGWSAPLLAIPMLQAVKLSNDMKEKFKNYVFTTKLGHFIAVFTISILLDSISLLYSYNFFVGMFWGSLFTSIILSIASKNKRWA